MLITLTNPEKQSSGTFVNPGFIFIALKLVLSMLGETSTVSAPSYLITNVIYTNCKTFIETNILMSLFKCKTIHTFI